jgi:hypothetical protein
LARAGNDQTPYAVGNIAPIIFSLEARRPHLAECVFKVEAAIDFRFLKINSRNILEDKLVNMLIIAVSRKKRR